MKKLVFILFLFAAFQSLGQNRFPSIDSAKNYTLRYYRNSTVETFTNLRGQNIAYGTLELIDSLAGNGAIDSIWFTGGTPDTLRYRKAGTTFTVGTISGGGGSSYTFTNGLTESGGTVKQGGSLTENTSIAGANYTYGITGLQSGEISAETIGGITSRLRVTPLADAGSLSTVNFTTGISSVTTSSTSGVNMSTTSYTSSKTSTITALPDSIRFETPDGRFSIPFLELGTDTINWKPTVWNPSTKRFARLGSWPSLGSTSLNNVGTGFDLAQQGTANVKRLAGGFGIKLDSTTTANTVRVSIDTTTQTLTDAATVTFDANLGVSAKVTLTATRTLAFSNFNNGMFLSLLVVQDGTGGWGLNLPAGTEVINGGGGVVTLTTAAASEDILTFWKIGNKIYCNYGKNYN